MGEGTHTLSHGATLRGVGRSGVEPGWLGPSGDARELCGRGPIECRQINVGDEEVIWEVFQEEIWGEEEGGERGSVCEGERGGVEEMGRWLELTCWGTKNAVG